MKWINVGGVYVDPNAVQAIVSTNGGEGVDLHLSSGMTLPIAYPFNYALEALEAAAAPELAGPLPS